MADRQREGGWRVAPILGARDVRAAVAYYVDKLGFACDPETGVFDGVGDEGAVYALLERDGVAIHLQIRRRERPAGGRESIERDAYLYVPDADALQTELEGRGARVRPGPTDAVYGMREVEVEDLDGNRITFGAPKAR